MSDENSSKINSNKFALIYEFNNQSPLFARVASDFYNNGEYDKALEILENGLKIYPNYPSAYFIYAKALAATGNLEKAKEIVAIGSELVDSDKTKDYYLDKIIEISNQIGALPDSKRTTFLGDEDLDHLPPDDITDSSIEILFSTGEEPATFEDNLEELAKELETAKIPPPPVPSEHEEIIEEKLEEEYEDDNFLADDFISETLAGIYLAQKNYVAAKNIYTKLINIEPEKSKLFKNKIAEIDKIISKQ